MWIHAVHGEIPSLPPKSECNGPWLPFLGMFGSRMARLGALECPLSMSVTSPHRHHAAGTGLPVAELSRSPVDWDPREEQPPQCHQNPFAFLTTAIGDLINVPRGRSSLFDGHHLLLVCPPAQLLPALGTQEPAVPQAWCCGPSGSRGPHQHGLWLQDLLPPALEQHECLEPASAATPGLTEPLAGLFAAFAPIGGCWGQFCHCSLPLCPKCHETQDINTNIHSRSINFYIYIHTHIGIHSYILQEQIYVCMFLYMCTSTLVYSPGVHTTYTYKHTSIDIYA